MTDAECNGRKNEGATNRVTDCEIRVAQHPQHPPPPHIHTHVLFNGLLVKNNSEETTHKARNKNRSISGRFQFSIWHCVLLHVISSYNFINKDHDKKNGCHFHCGDEMSLKWIKDNNNYSNMYVCFLLTRQNEIHISQRSYIQKNPLSCTPLKT